MSAPRLFLNYRRVGDVADAVARVYDRLAATFGKGRVFKDVDDLLPGEEFAPYIRKQLRQCRVLLVMIGPRWAEVTRHGQPRLHDPDDWVRVEIETALGLGLRVIPVLVNGAQLPPREALPASLHPLLGRQAAEVGQDRDFHPHVDRLERDLQRLFDRLGAAEPGETKPPSPAPAAPTFSAPRDGARWTLPCGDGTIEFVGVPAGTFWMGATPESGART